jgi:aminotransferase
MIIDLAKGTPIYVKTREDRNFRIDPEDIKDSVTPKTKLIILVTPDNPTGSVLTEKDVKAIADIAKDNDLFILSDQMYEKIIYDDHKHYSIASIPGMKKRTITICGFSKAYAMTGWRVGYAATHKDLATPIIDLHCINVTQGCIISQKGAVAALKGPEPRYIWEELEKRRNTLADGLNDIPGITCQKNWGGICLMANISSFGMSCLEFAKFVAKETNVIMSPGTAFGKGTVGGNGGKGYISCGYAATKNENIKMAVDKISEAVKKLEKR